jgi:hypothetical protein
MRTWRRWIACAALALAGADACAQSELDSAPALEAARIWLATLDAGRYGASWENAAPVLKGSMTRVQWETGLESARAPLGVVIVRKIRQASCTRGTPADPEAELCVVQYDTRFENRPLTTEVVTPIRGRDGAWRVSAYVLR